MNEPVQTLALGGDADTECPSVSACVTAWKTGGEAAEDARADAARRESSAPPPYLFRGRKGRCFFKPKKMRWRKG